MAAKDSVNTRPGQTFQNLPTNSTNEPRNSAVISPNQNISADESSILWKAQLSITKIYTSKLPNSAQNHMRYTNAVCSTCGPVLFKTSLWEVLTLKARCLSLMWWKRRYVRRVPFPNMSDSQSVPHIKTTDCLIFRAQPTNRVMEEQGSSVPLPVYARASAQPLPKTHRTSISGEDSRYYKKGRTQRR